MLRKIVIPFGILLIAVALAAFMGVFKKKPEKKEREIPPTYVDTIEARAKDLTFIVESQGTVEPRTETTLIPEISGKIVKVSPNLVAGGVFREGEVLLEIDRSDYEAALKSAEAEVARRSSLLEIEEARHDQARRDWERLGEGEASPLALNIPQLKEAKANYQSAEAALDRAKRNLERTRLRAPYEGMVRAKMADIGQYVTPGTPLAEIFAIDYAEVRLPLSTKDLAFLDLPDWSDRNPSQNAPRVVLSARYLGEDQQWEGAVVRTEGTVDVRTRQVFAVARIKDPYARKAGSSHKPLPMGLFVEAAIDGITAEGIIPLPRQVLRPDGTLLVVTPEETIDVRKVTITRSEASTLYVSEGLKDGEAIAMTALEFVSDGMPVKIIGSESDQKPEAELKETAAQKPALAAQP